MPLRAIYYDTETTGIKAEKDRIIELAAYDPLHDRWFESFINPGLPIPKEATAIHHITDEMVADAPSFAEVGKQFIDFCEGEVLLIAHNNDSFDVHFLRNEFGRHAIEMPSWKFLDSLKWARRYRPDLPKHSLQFLREIYQIPENNAHRARDDVDVLYRTFFPMIGDLSIDVVYNLLNRTREITTMPFGKHKDQPLDKVPKHYVQWLSENGALDKPENSDLKQAFQKLGILSNK
jgi:DNA polymerase III subunit epsilon